MRWLAVMLHTQHVPQKIFDWSYLSEVYVKAMFWLQGSSFFFAAHRTTTLHNRASWQSISLADTYIPTLKKLSHRTDQRCMWEQVSSVTVQSINQSIMGSIYWGRITMPTLWHHSQRSYLVSPMQAPFPYWVTPSRRHRLATAMSSVGVPLASSMLSYPF